MSDTVVKKEEITEELMEQDPLEGSGIPVEITVKEENEDKQIIIKEECKDED